MFERIFEMVSKDEDGREKANSRSNKLGIGSWTIMVVLVVLLGATMFVSYLGLRLGDGADVPVAGYVAMALGVTFSLAVGFGLMALVFYSSRKGYDEPPVFLARSDIDQD